MQFYQNHRKNFVDIVKLILNFIWKSIGTRIAEIILKREIIFTTIKSMI